MQIHVAVVYSSFQKKQRKLQQFCLVRGIVTVVKTMISTSGFHWMTSGHRVGVQRVFVVHFYDFLSNRHTTDPLAGGRVTHQVERIRVGE